MRTPVNLKEARRTGTDAFGNFHITGGPCTNCDRVGLMCVHYRFNTAGVAVKLPDGIKYQDTILKNPNDAYLGINCGCYAKFHRQVAHIQDKMKERE